MSAGTLNLTNNSTAVTGSDTTFTTELEPGDFIVVTVGSVPYTLPVDKVNDNTSLTLISNFTGPTQAGAAWGAVPRKVQNLVTADLVNQVALALRGLNDDKQNWQKVFSEAGDITVTLPDGSIFTGPSWKYLTENTVLKGAGMPYFGTALSVDLNTLGAYSAAGVHYQPSNAGATTANHYPIAEAGTLMVTPGAYGCQQEYTAFSSGRKFVRGLAGPWNGTNGQWNDWKEIPTLATADARYNTKTVQSTAGAVGSMAFLSNNTAAAIGAGGTVAGSSLSWASAGASWSDNGTNGRISRSGTPAGTWRALGYCAGTWKDGGNASLFIRIS